MYRALVFALALAVVGCGEQQFPLRTDTPPAEWNADEMNEALGPYNSNKGIIHVLAWEAIEELKDGKTYSQKTQVLVFKRFDEPTKGAGNQWILVRLFCYPEKQKWRLREPWIFTPPAVNGEGPPMAAIFGYEWYLELPTDQQIEAFLSESGFTPRLGPARKLIAGGINRKLWKQIFARDVPARLFPELSKATHDE